jgi:DNA-binding transcriptional ArsR family regulator
MPRPQTSRRASPQITQKIGRQVNSKTTPAIKPLAKREIDIDRLFHALGDPTRRAILDRLSSLGPLSVSALAAPLDITLTAVAQHLQIFEESALVHTEKLGRVRTCRIETTGFSALEQWIREHRSLWQRRLDQLGDLLAEPEENE